MNKILDKVKSSPLLGEFQVIWKFFYNNFLAYVLLYIQNVLINKYMPTESLGKYSYGQSMLILFASVYSMEVYSVYLRYMGCSNEKKLLQSTRRILTLASVLFTVTVLVYFKNPFYILFFAYMWMHERLYFFRAKMDISTYGKIKIAQYLISIGILLGLVFGRVLNEKTLLLGIGISYFVVSVIYSVNSKARKQSIIEEDFPTVSANELVKYALPLAFNAIVVWLLGAADQFLIDHYLDSTTLTYYSVAFRIISVIRIGVGVIMEYWPRFYFERMERQEFASVKAMYKLFIIVVISLCVGTIIFSKQIYWLMGAGSYSEYRWMFCMLAFAEMFRQMGSINMTFQSFMKNNVINVVCLAILGSMKLLVNALMIASQGVNVLFYTTVFCYVMYFVCSMFFGYAQEKKYMHEK